jgi:dienelactone hydrolase
MKNGRILLGTILLFLQCHNYVDAFWIRPSAPVACCLNRNTQQQTVVNHVHRPCKNLYLNSDDDASSDESEDNAFFDSVALPDDREMPLTSEDLADFNVSQLKQQLRLRSLPVSGRKAELVDRLLRFSGTYVPSQADADDDDRFVDVSDYVNAEDMGTATKSIPIGDQQPLDPDQQAKDDMSEDTYRFVETWGSDARIVDDYEGRDVVVDSISRTVVEYTGSNQTTVQAYVAATRDALQPFLQQSNSTKTSAEERLVDIQTRREQAAKRPMRLDDDAGLDEGDETGLYKDILNRDYSDWGKFTTTGAQLSAQEVQGVLLLTDIYGFENDDTRALAEKIAFECQPVVVMVPDLFRGKPWKGPSTAGLNEDGLTYEGWRAQHDDLRISVDIRAAAACLRERYAVSSVVVWGTCFGGGKTLEAAAGWLPEDSVHDVDGSVGPPLVAPMAAIAWYPTRYNVADLFGKRRSNKQSDGQASKMAVMAIFGGKDTIPGATSVDAAELRALLQEDDRVVDHMVKVFPDQNHGFAHRGLATPSTTDNFERFVDEEFGGAGRVTADVGDAEVACLLSTAFMETYSRVFLPTTGPPISLDESEKEWAQNLEMKDVKLASQRDVRKEIETSVENFVEMPLGGKMMDPSNKSQEEELAKILRSMQDASAVKGDFVIDDSDDLATIYAKLTSGPDKFELF